MNPLNEKLVFHLRRKQIQHQQRQQAESSLCNGTELTKNGSSSAVNPFLSSLPRTKLIEQRLEAIVEEYHLPSIETMIEILKASNVTSDQIDFGSKDQAALWPKPTPPPAILKAMGVDKEDICNITIVSTNDQQDEPDRIINYEGIMKGYLSYVKQFLQVERPETVEKAGVYLLWVFFDSFNLSTIFVPDAFPDPSIYSMPQNNLFGHFNTLEYLFNMEISNTEMNQVGDNSRQVLDIFGHDNFEKIFYRASLIKKTIIDLEAEQQREMQTNWLEAYEKRVIQDSIGKDCSFEDIANVFFDNSADDYIPLCSTEADLVKKMDPSLRLDYVNYEFILQEELIRGVLSTSSSDEDGQRKVDNIVNKSENVSPEDCSLAAAALKTFGAGQSTSNSIVAGSSKDVVVWQKGATNSSNNNNNNTKATFDLLTSNEELASNALVVTRPSPEDETTTTESYMQMLSKDLSEFISNYLTINQEAFYISHAELYDKVIEWIMSEDLDVEVFTQLNNLMGDINLGMIEKIINFYRPKIRESNKRNMAANDSNSRPSSQSGRGNYEKEVKFMNRNRGGGGGGGGVKGPSIIIQTEKEKALRKEVRKAGKKINREITRAQKADNNILGGCSEDQTSSKLTIDDLQAMRSNTIKNVIKAAMEPRQQLLLAEARPVVKYPHVYDQLANVKTSASYVAGTQMVLPEGCQRKDSRMCEEMTIPIMENGKDTEHFLGQFPRISISECDEFLRIGFKGFLQLNLIQSTVFPVAYEKENQNMLICAPTGAGKTNIAMLAILNVLRTYSVDNTPKTIKREQFKIVYIAPMKALCAEMAASFGKRLAPFGVNVRELTGDMQLTNREIMETQMLVVTPEKWDIVTRKSLGDVQLLDLVKLVIIDEVHLLQSDRGHVLETLVARTVRYVERSQKFIRLVGLSATLPNYTDVAEFLRVDPYQGLFMFDERFRPVPLMKRFIGCKTTNKAQLNQDMDEITFGKVKEVLLKENQVMVFVHSRNATLGMANFLLNRSKSSNANESENVGHLFVADTTKLADAAKIIDRARYRNLNKFLLAGIGLHHAGMPRPERNIVEKLFTAGVIRVLICTSTLAWGVNLPAQSVIIRGTEYYDPARGSFVDIDMLDVVQIFGRAGRPQFDKSGEATIITQHDRLAFYLSMLTNQLPIESTFLKRLTDNLNAEIVLGTVGTIAEAVEWLRYTYAYIRMSKNPIEYGLRGMPGAMDPGAIIDHLTSLARASAEALDSAEMIRYMPVEGQLDETHLGRIASHFYVQHETIVYLKQVLQDTMDYGHIFDMLSKSHEFQQLRCREEEIEHLDTMKYNCMFHMKNAELSNTHTKVNILMQNSITGAHTDSHSLGSDLMYIQQNVTRLTRGLFEYVLKKGMPRLAQKLLNLTIMFDKKVSIVQTPMKQFSRELPAEVIAKLDTPHLTIFDLCTMSVDDIGNLIRDKKHAAAVKHCAQLIPQVEMEATVRPITRTILTVYVDVRPDFIWDNRHHGQVGQSFWLWIVDDRHDHIYHVEMGRFTKKQVVRREVQRFVFTIPLLDAQYLKEQYFVHCTFEGWLGTEAETVVSCANLRLPEKYLPQTKLLDLSPLPISALQNEMYQANYKFEYFNPIQTQIFHTLYHTNHNVLLGAPTGSGKTIAAELALFRVFNTNPTGKVVYIAPLKALVRERVDDWRVKIERNMGRRIVELTGDVTPDVGTINEADIIVTTPEKWDGVSRGWPSRRYVREVALIIIDEIHLLGEDRGPVLEMIVSRANFICRRTKEPIRIVGLSTAVANAQDLASWLNIQKIGLYNFSSSVRPVPIEVHVSGFSGKHYCPRMASMNKPAYRAIKKYSPQKPVIIFVSSRRQTRLTAIDLIGLLTMDMGAENSFLNIDLSELSILLETVQDMYLKHTLNFGIGMHHAGLRESDRKLVEQLFAEQKIRILVTTATLAWGVNLPAHAVIIKGTEYFDGKTNRYVDFPITDVLQMIGRAGRPQFDTSAVAVLFVQDIKKEYYQKFLYEPFPVESHLLDVFPDHLNAEIGSNTVKTKSEALEFLSSTYLYHRIFKNPSYYDVSLEGVEDNEMAINQQVMLHLSAFIDKCVNTLADDYCVRLVPADPDDPSSSTTLVATPLGRISSFYYLSHDTIRLFQDELGAYDGVPRFLPTEDVLDLLTRANEYATLPVRHNEEMLNDELAKKCPISMARKSMDSAHTKASILIQAHCSRLKLPVVDYYTDLKSVLDQAIRIMQAMVDIAALNGSLATTINIINLQQSIMQASWQHDNQILSMVVLDDQHRGGGGGGELNTYKEDTLNDANEYFEKLISREDHFAQTIKAIPADICTLPFLLNFVHQDPGRALSNLSTLFHTYQVKRFVIDRLHRALMRLPLVSLERMELIEVGGGSGDDDESADDGSPAPPALSNNKIIVPLVDTFKPLPEMQWLNLKAGGDYLLQVSLSKLRLEGGGGGGRGRGGGGHHRQAEPKAHCPRFPKPKSESWYLVLGVPETGELVAITRVANIPTNRTSTATLQFCAPDAGAGGVDGHRVLYSVYLLSDCYIGLDQQYHVPVSVN